MEAEIAAVGVMIEDLEGQLREKDLTRERRLGIRARVHDLRIEKVALEEERDVMRKQKMYIRS